MGGKHPCETIFLYGGTSNRTLFLYLSINICSHFSLKTLALSSKKCTFAAKICVLTQKIQRMIYFERKEYLNKLISAEGNGMIKIITGIRRCGKSFLLFNIFCKHLLERGVAENHIIQVSNV